MEKNLLAKTLQSGHGHGVTFYRGTLEQWLSGGGLRELLCFDNYLCKSVLRETPRWFKGLCLKLL